MQRVFIAAIVIASLSVFTIGTAESQAQNSVAVTNAKLNVSLNGKNISLSCGKALGLKLSYPKLALKGSQKPVAATDITLDAAKRSAVLKYANGTEATLSLSDGGKLKVSIRNAPAEVQGFRIEMIPMFVRNQDQVGLGQFGIIRLAADRVHVNDLVLIGEHECPMPDTGDLQVPGLRLDGIDLEFLVGRRLRHRATAPGESQGDRSYDRTGAEECPSVLHGLFPFS